ncbi:MAG TPA: heavy-metal-associated domain-containing protein [Steroidobacteraceae bacterium]|nr:heavy-metal-associated domain-containing protein [Steroidobacteraceae bacterium]
MKKLILIACASIIGVAAAGTIEMKVNGMVCELCAQGIEKSLRKNPATTDVVVNLEKKVVAVSTRAGQDISDVDLSKAVAAAGFEVKGIARTQRSLDAIRAELKQTAQ